MGTKWLVVVLGLALAVALTVALWPSPEKPLGPRIHVRVSQGGATQPSILGNPPDQTQPAEEAKSIPAVVGRDTTYVVEPLLPDGSVDLIAAYNASAGKGVTNENNAFVALLQAYGPEMLPADKRQPVMDALGLKPEAGKPGFVKLEDYLRAHPPRSAEEARAAALRADEFLSTHARRRPWSPSEQVDLSLWIVENKAALDAIAEATRRRRYFVPRIWANPGRSGSESFRVNDADTITQIANVLTARAMLRVESGHFIDGLSDLVAVMRLGRLLQQESFVQSWLAGNSEISIAQNAMIELCVRQAITIDEARTALSGIDPLPPLVTISRAFEPGERLLYISKILDAQKETSLKPWLSLSEIREFTSATRKANSNPTGWENVLPHAPIIADINVILRHVNAAYDTVTGSSTRPEHTGAIAALRAFKDAARKRRDESQARLSSQEFWKSYAQMTPQQKRDAMTPMLSSFACWGIASDSEQFRNRDDQCLTQYGLTRLALALLIYRLEKGQYPDFLADIAPQYINALPKDLFTGGNLRYRRNTDGQGYTLYSLGPNGADDEAKPGTDDIAVRVPSPPATQPATSP